MASTDGIPNSLLAKIPVRPPPPGVESNFIDPPNCGWQFITVGGVMLPVTLLFLGIRAYSKLRICRKCTWDDLTCVLSVVGICLWYTTVCIAIVKGGFGRHVWDTSMLQAISPYYAWPVYTLIWCSDLMLPLVKLTFLIFYLQVFAIWTWFRICCWAGIVCTSAAFFSFFVAQMIMQTPHPGESWLQMQQSPREVASLQHLSLPITATSFGLDLYTFILPIAAVSKLHLSPRRKLGVVLVFLTGFAGIIASFLSLYYKIYLNGSKADFTWAVMKVEITTMVEMCVGVCCSCAPSLAKFVGHRFPDFDFIDSLLSLKAFSFISRWYPTSSRSIPSFVRKEPLNKTGHESDANLKKSGTSLENRDKFDAELGLPMVVQTEVESGEVIEMDRLPDIHLQRQWIQSSST